MAELRGVAEPELAALLAQVDTLADVAARYHIEQVVVQDEFTHDVLIALPDGRALAFDST
jgi:hypothetical protein